MDTFLAIASKRDTRRYADAPVPEDVQTRILDAGRLAGSARNRQPWRFVVAESSDVRERLADAVYAPDNVRGAQFVVAIVGGGAGLDHGRCAQNMMLAALDEGVVSCPNGIADADAAAAAVGATGEDKVMVVLSFGYPVRPRPERPAEEWSTRADRKPLDELVTRL